MDTIGSITTAPRTTSSRDMVVDHGTVAMAEAELLVQCKITATLVGSMICTKTTKQAGLKIIHGRMMLTAGVATARMEVADEEATVGFKMAI